MKSELRLRNSQPLDKLKKIYSEVRPFQTRKVEKVSENRHENESVRPVQ